MISEIGPPGGLADLATKRCDDTAGESETHQTERYAYDGEAQQQAAQYVADEDYEPTKYEEHQIA